MGSIYMQARPGMLTIIDEAMASLPSKPAVVAELRWASWEINAWLRPDVAVLR